MITFKKRLATIVFLAFISTATIVSCGKQGNKDEQAATGADSSEHPSDSTAQESDHPEDSTKNQ